MFRIALIQNLSEMLHYSYADMRHLIKNKGYEPVLFTAENIGTLPYELQEGRIDAVVFASSSLNDAEIRERVSSEDFRNAFQRFFAEGKGCLVLNQQRVAESREPLHFLPYELKSVYPASKERDPVEGNISGTELTSSNVCFLYPKKIEIQELNKVCKESSIPGLYRHSWGDICATEWDVLLKDEGSGDVIYSVTRESGPYRIVLCSMTLDWQDHRDLLENTLLYIVEGKHTIAVLESDKADIDFRYMIEYLRSWRYPVRQYTLDRISEILENIERGIHSAILLDPALPLDRLDEVSEKIRSSIDNGSLKLFAFNDIKVGCAPVKSLSIMGRERYSIRSALSMLPDISSEMSKGYIDGSFWSSVDVLKTLSETDFKDYIVKEKIEQLLKNDNLGRIFDLAYGRHDKSGSYDGVFAVTCAYLWLEWMYLGDSTEFHRTLGWIKNNIERVGPVEKLRAINMFMALKIPLDDVEHYMDDTLQEYMDRTELLDIEMTEFLEAVVHKEDIKGIEKAVAMLKLSDNKEKMDLNTVAVLLPLIVKSRRIFEEQKGPNNHSGIVLDLENIALEYIIFIQSRRESTDLSHNYPWSGKASTSVKCVCACAYFDELTDLPIQEVRDILEDHANAFCERSSSLTAISIVEGKRREAQSMLKRAEEERNCMEKEKTIYKRQKNAYLASLSLIAVTVPFTILIFCAVDGVLSQIAYYLVNHIPIFAAMLTSVALIVTLLIAIDRKITKGYFIIDHEKYR